MSQQKLIAPPVVLTIAGFDPSGGAGIIADVKTFHAFACKATAAVTSLTFQNTRGVFGARHQTAGDVRAQVLPIVEEFQVAGMKTGMLPTRELISEVARLLDELSSSPHELPAPVVDPVIRSTSGYALIDDNALDALQTQLLPRARLITPNIPEAMRLTNLQIEDEEGMRRAALALREVGAHAVLIKGGHLAGDALDLLLDEAGVVHLFRAPRIERAATHGTGCMLSAAIAACLARGMHLPEAVAAAKQHVRHTLLSTIKE